VSLESFDPASLERVLRTFPVSARLIVAFSGGPDSTALLHALSRLEWPLLAVHVDHGLDKNSRDRSQQAESMAGRWNVPFIAHRIQVPPGAAGGLEHAARKARYQALVREMETGDLLLTAHHADDQAETVLLRLMRGSGPAGLGGIRPLRKLGPGWLARPLLDWPRQTLADYLDQQQIQGLEDPANRDLSRDRNYLRHQVMPLLHARWPAAAGSIGRSARHLQAVDREITRQADRELDHARAGRHRLALEPFSGLDELRRKALIRRWLDELGWSMPSTVRLDTFIGQVESAAPDRRPCLEMPDGVLVREGPFIHARNHASKPGPFCITWDGLHPLELPDGRGRLLIKGKPGVTLPPETWPVTIRNRTGGEKIRLHGNHRRPVKKLFQEAGIPVRARALFPFIFAEDRLVAVGDRWQDEQFSANLHRRGQSLVWEVPETGSIQPADDPRVDGQPHDNRAKKHD